jgi:nucleotidyltransferase/DNA polymerase involved in DNA repair
MGRSESTAASAKDARQLTISNLMEIDGIAQKTAEAMVELDIQSYADLVEYLSQHTAQELSSALKEHGVNRPPALIDQETWTEQAERFSQLEEARQLTISKLAKIDGIAQKTAEALVELDIHGYADLIQYLSRHTARKISAALKEHGVNRPPAFIDQETWIRQAERFSQLADTGQLDTSESMEIEGIAEKTVEATVEFDIHSYAELIEYLDQRIAREVSAALTSHGLNRPPGLINQQRSAGQADLFSQSEDTPTTPSEEETEPTKHSREALPSPEPREHDALFTVSFDVARDEDGEPALRTTVYDESDAGKGEIFRGNGTTPWVNWMLERANLPFAVEYMAGQDEITREPPPTETEAAAAPPVPNGLCDAQLEIGDIQLSEHEPTPEYPGKRLEAEIRFQVSGADAERLTSQSLPYRIEGHTVNLESGASKLVAFRRSQLEPQVFEYRSQERFDTPEVGHYEFHCIVLLLPPVELAAYHRGPTMQVVP